MAFALWKQPEKLPAALGELIARFPDADELAVTMTGELCDCFETKREGVRQIVNAVMNVSRSRPIRIWSTGGAFLNSNDAKDQHLKVAAANWHALATFVGQKYANTHGALLIDIGSTTTDLIPLWYGVPTTYGSTDSERLKYRELVYTGAKRTPVCAIVQDRIAAELFATTQDVYVLLGELPEDSNDRDTSDGRPRTRRFARDRLARMLGGDSESTDEESVLRLASAVARRQMDVLLTSAKSAYFDAQSPPELRTIVGSGSGEFLALQVARHLRDGNSRIAVASLAEQIGPVLSAAAPAYAVAMLAAGRPQ